MRKSFRAHWEDIMKEAEKLDKDLPDGSGFGGLIPFLAIFLGWIPALGRYTAQMFRSKK